MLMAKNYEELNFSDDFIFGKVMEDTELCRELLECLLGQPIGELENVQAQRQLRYTRDGKPIRLDLYTKDDNTVYDAEMQNRNHQSIQKLELAKRSRFYQSMMDMDFLDKGKFYRRLPDGKVLFICTFDPFGAGKAKYTFLNQCQEEPAIRLNDGTEKIYYNCTSIETDMPEEMRKLYDFILLGRESSPLTRKLASSVRQALKNEKWRSEYMKELLHDDDIRMDALADSMRLFIRDKVADGMEAEKIVQKLMYVFSLTEKDAVDYFSRYTK